MSSKVSASDEAQLRTRAFARVIGPYVATFTILYAIRLPDLLWLINDLFAQPVLVFMLGTLMLGAGLVIIGGHRSWRGPLAITISAFGWFVALRDFFSSPTPPPSRRPSTRRCSRPPRRSWPGSSSPFSVAPACC